MTSYFLRRLILIIPTFLGITVLVFAITRAVPGGPVEQAIAEMQRFSEGSSSSNNSIGGASLSDEQLQELKEYYGFDKPMLQSYFLWLGKVLKFDLGVSSRYNEPVWDVIKDRFPVSIFYGLITTLLTYLVCLPLGLIKAIKHSSFFDNATSALVFLGYAIPGYVVGVAVIFLFASHWEFFPLGGFTSDEFDDLEFWEQVMDVLYHGVLPLISYVAGSFAVTTLLMKNSLMDNLAADYVRTAMAKGFSFKESVFKHALRNSLIPLATHFGNNISLFLTGSFLIETIFNIDGLGLLGYESVVQRDYPIVLGILVMSSLLYMIGNILSDICVVLVDPRVKFQ